jgi:hypothetical protein
MRALRVMRTIALAGIILLSMTASGSDNETGVIGRTYEDGLPVIYAFDKSAPSQDMISRFPWLTIVSWKYDGSGNNGMPTEETNVQMIKLEDALSAAFQNSSNSTWAFNRTGNHLKEFAYYISDRNSFLEMFNEVLSSHPRYPVEVTFYNDSTWSEMKDLLTDFGNHGNDL